MMDDNSMDVDAPRTPPRFGFRTQDSPISPSLSLPQNQVDKFKTDMIEASGQEDWPDRLTRAGDNREKLLNVFKSVLTYRSTALLGFTLPKGVILYTFDEAKELVHSLNDRDVEEWKNAVQKGDWEVLIAHRLGAAYAQDFIGNTATDFIKHLEQADLVADMGDEKPLYAKAISVVQSSGTGKSRMLTEAGKQIFTLPICLRKPYDPGYPPGDKPVLNFFSSVPRNNDLSYSAHTAIACFLAAAHTVMLETLQETGLEGQKLLRFWNELMEPTDGVRTRREAFFTIVIKQAESMRMKLPSDNSPSRASDGQAPSDFDPWKWSSTIYQRSAKEATEKLVEFLSKAFPEKQMCITYFDEAHELGLHFWILLRLVQHQDPSTKMWYGFMGTKSSVSYYAPRPNKMLSLRLKNEVARLLPPYIDLGFDQRAMATSSEVISVSMGKMQSIEFLCKYGRPMWYAHLPEQTPGEMITLASWKLRNGEAFRAMDKSHVFAVLSQRLCLDPVMAASEALELADRSVAHHMRLLTGFSTNSERFYTHSPSEPILVLGSVDILYNTTDPGRLQEVLNTLSHDLCSAGLVEKGILGELGACILILIARDFASPPRLSGWDLLIPVRLLRFLDTLFGKDLFSGADRRMFEKAFDMAHVNFTHWIITQDSIPENPSLQLLANLWARGGALQCCFSQESIEFLIVLYFGSVDPDSTFNPSQLSGFVGQVKFKIAGDKKAEAVIRPIGIPRNRQTPLPYLAMLMELGNESRYMETSSKIRCTTPEPLGVGKFGKLCDDWDAAVKRVEWFRKQSKRPKDTLDTLKKAANDARHAMDSYNRYSLSVRGISKDVYGILRKARIEREFATLLSIVMPSPIDERSTRQHMRPLERLSEASSHTDWMSEYI